MTVATKPDAAGNRIPVQGIESEPGFQKQTTLQLCQNPTDLVCPAWCSGDVLVPEAALGGLEGEVVVCHCRLWGGKVHIYMNEFFI